MTKINPKIVLVILGLVLYSNSIKGQSDTTYFQAKLVNSLITAYDSIRNEEDSRLREIEIQIRQEIGILDSKLYEGNSYLLSKKYKEIDDLYDSSEIESLITKYSNKTESKQNRKQAETKIKKIISMKRSDVLDSLIKLCGLKEEHNESLVSERLSYIVNRETARDLHEKYLCNKLATTLISVYEVNRNLQLISEHLNYLDDEQFILYSSYTSAPKKFKSIELNHGNDIFTNFNIGSFNQDREMTGSFRLSITTDYFKARWLNIGEYISKNWLKRNTLDVLSYQTISFGGVGFTPYIRHQDNIELADTFHNHDRPFGSFVYLSRSKNRLWQKGLVRHMGEFQLGFIGLEAPDAVQASLHKDFIVSSQRVHGWNKQIGDPGRLALQINHDFDFLLLSNTNKYKALLGKKDNTPRYTGANLIGSLELKGGTYMTSFGGGISFSTLDFTKQSGQNAVVFNPNKKEQGFHFETGIRYRRVIHNSMLEGLGFINPFFKDSFDIDPVNAYVLSREENQINENMFFWDWKVVWQHRKMAFYFKQTFHNLEYNITPFDVNSTEATNLLSANPDADIVRENYYNKTTSKEYPSLYERGWYGFGTLGFVWLIN
jgi:hypothetical protein